MKKDSPETSTAAVEAQVGDEQDDGEGGEGGEAAQGPVDGLLHLQDGVLPALIHNQPTFKKIQTRAPRPQKRARSSFFRTCSPCRGAAATVKARTVPTCAAAVAARRSTLTCSVTLHARASARVMALAQEHPAARCQKPDQAMAQAGTVLAFNVAAAPVEGLQVRKKLERALRDWFQGERTRFVLFGAGGSGKSTLAVKFAAAEAERGGGRLRLVFVLSASSMEPDYTGLLGQCPRLACKQAP